MRDSVRAAWVKTNTPLEGVLPWMYLDRLGNVTSGMGDLLEPVGAALAVEWVNPDGSTVSDADVAAAWNAVDALRSDPKGELQTSGPATQGGGAFGPYTTIRLTPTTIQALVAGKLDSMEPTLRARYKNWDSQPADSQWGILSMSWAMGEHFEFPDFDAAINAGQYAKAAPLSVFRGTGVQTRIADDQLAFKNAQVVVDNFLPREILYYPRTLTGATRAQLLAWAAALTVTALGIAVAVSVPLRERALGWMHAAGRWVTQ